MTGADDLSRRSFFGRLSGTFAAGTGNPQPEPPRRAWILVARNWEYNDEYSYADGEQPLTRLYFERGAAEAECRKLCAEFFGLQTPAAFEVDFGAYFGERAYRPDFDEAAVTWEELLERGFPSPYSIEELQA